MRLSYTILIPDEPIPDQLISMLGQLLGDYEIQQEAGRGPSATVYVARQHPVERYVAVKMFEPQSREVTNRLREKCRRNKAHSSRCCRASLAM